MVSFAAKLAGDVAKMARINNLGTLLNEVYPDGSRAPDDFSLYQGKIAMLIASTHHRSDIFEQLIHSQW